MKKIYILLLIAFTFFLLPVHEESYANEFNNEILSGEYQFYLGDSNSKLILALIIDFKDSQYTYAPDYSPYPTHFFMDKAEYEVKYKVAEKSFDPLTKSNLELYRNNIEYFFVFDSYADNAELQMSLLLCTAENCRPYSDTLNISFPQHIENLEDISQSESAKSYQSAKSIHNQSYYESSGINRLNTVQVVQDIAKEEFNFLPQAYNTSLEVTSFGLAMLFGIVAGFVLNLMPCVLPVVAIKITSLIQTSHYDEMLQNKNIRTHGLFFGLGILCFFVFLSIFIGFFDMIWGELFQNIFFLIILINLIFLFGLSLIGLFSFPFFNIRENHSFSPQIQAFTQGFIATVIATPCSGPLLGGVLAFSITLPIYMSILVFLAMGFGMALPYFSMAMYPRIVKFIPKPGKWTGILEKILAFMFFFTAIYLLSLVPNALLYKVILSLFILAFFSFLYSLIAYKKHAKIITLILFCLYIVAFYTLFVRVEDTKSLDWTEYSYQEFTQNLGQENLLVTFTADWCPTCKVLESTVLNYENIQPLVDTYNLKLIKVDITHPDISKENFLKSLDSASIPLLAFFPDGIFAYSPIILRDIYTLNQIESVLETHF